jgi:hypothetical protein
MAKAKRSGEEAIMLRPAVVLAALKLLIIGVFAAAAMTLSPTAAPGSASTSLTAEIMHRGRVTLLDSASADDPAAIAASNGRYIKQIDRVERDGEIITLITVVIDL